MIITRNCMIYCSFLIENHAVQYKAMMMNLAKPTRLQGYKVTRLQDFKVTRSQGDKVSKSQSHKVTSVQYIVTFL